MNDGVIRTRDCPRCPLCGRKGRWLYRDLRDRLFDAPGAWNIRVCSDASCGLLWLDPAPVTEALPLLYRNYFTHTDKPAERTGVVRRIYRLALLLSGLACQRDGLRLMFLQHARPGRLLEVGCGDGERLAQFRDLGWEVEGQELDGIAATRAQARGLKIHRGALTKLSLPENYCDAVVMNHVIEHVDDPAGLLRECRRILKPEGSLRIVTPNTASLGHRRFAANWLALDPPRHLILFSPHTLETIARDAGFHECRCWTTAANAQFTAEGSLAIHRCGKHKFGASPGVGLRIRSLLFQLRATVTRQLQNNSGEECVLAARP